MPEPHQLRSRAARFARSRLPLVWLLMGNRAGDNHQLLALAQALDWPFEAKQINFNQLRRIPALRRGLTPVARNSRSLLRPPWPDLVLAVGYGAVPVARFIRDQSGGNAKLVHIGNPRAAIDDFDLQITTPQYAREPVANVLELPFPIGNPGRDAKPTFEELSWLRYYPRPRRLVAVGGPARYWELDNEELVRSISRIREKQSHGSLIAVVSNRTRSSTLRLLRELVRGEHEAVVADFPSFPTLLSECDEIYVTADSVSMLSEAVLTGKPVGMIPIRRSFRGKLSEELWERPTGKRSFPDFANFWDLLQREQLIGTVDLPLASRVCDTVDRAADAVRALIAPGKAVDQKPNTHLGASGGPSRGQQSSHRTR